MKFRFRSKHIPLLATAFVLFGLYTAGCIAFSNFWSLRVAVNLIGDNAFLGVAAVGATFVILSGGIDLSVGAVVAFTSTLIAALIEKHGVHPLFAVAIALAAGAFFGFSMGCVIRWFELPAFLVTLAGMFLARGAGFIIHPQSLGIQHPFFLETISQTLSLPLNQHVSLPFTASCFLVVLLVALFVAHYTKFGRYIYALGGDEQSATLMGLPVGRTSLWEAMSNPPLSWACRSDAQGFSSMRFPVFVRRSRVWFMPSTPNPVTPLRASAWNWMRLPPSSLAALCSVAVSV